MRGGGFALEKGEDCAPSSVREGRDKAPLQKLKARRKAGPGPVGEGYPQACFPSQQRAQPESADSVFVVPALQVRPRAPRPWPRAPRPWAPPPEPLGPAPRAPRAPGPAPWLRAPRPRAPRAPPLAPPPGPRAPPAVPGLLPTNQLLPERSAFFAGSRRPFRGQFGLGGAGSQVSHVCLQEAQTSAYEKNIHISTKASARECLT